MKVHLGTKDLQDELQPHVEKLEQEYEGLKQKWQELEDASEKSAKDVEKGFKVCVGAMQDTFDKVKKHFSDDKKDAD